MNLHSFTEYLKYSRKAKGRHGTHSPFVYALVEEVLQDKGPLKKQYNINCAGMELKYENLLSRIAAYYNYENIVCLPGTVNGLADMLVVHTESGEWAALLEQNLQWLKNESMVVITGIHKTAAHSTAWAKLTAYTEVRMSIDLYGMGLLLFRQEFKEKQHFILKY